MTFADKELAVLLFPNLTRTFEESYEASELNPLLKRPMSY